MSWDLNSFIKFSFFIYLIIVHKLLIKTVLQPLTWKISLARLSRVKFTMLLFFFPFHEELTWKTVWLDWRRYVTSCNISYKENFHWSNISSQKLSKLMYKLSVNIDKELSKLIYTLQGNNFCIFANESTGPA